MRCGVIAKKVGMTRVFAENGSHVPVTVLQMENCQVTSVRNKDKDGYTANILGFLKPKKLNKPQLKDFNKKTYKVSLTPGDILIYDGCQFEHWREKFTKNTCTQVFLHYNKKGSDNIYDKRERLGLPVDLKIQ